MTTTTTTDPDTLMSPRSSPEQQQLRDGKQRAIVIKCYKDKKMKKIEIADEDILFDEFLEKLTSKFPSLQRRPADKKAKPGPGGSEAMAADSGGSHSRVDNNNNGHQDHQHGGQQGEARSCLRPFTIICRHRSYELEVNSDLTLSWFLKAIPPLSPRSAHLKKPSSKYPPNVEIFKLWIVVN